MLLLLELLLELSPFLSRISFTMASSAASLVVSAVPVDVEDELEDEPEELLPEWLPARLPACPSALSPVDVLLSASDDCVSLPVVVDEPPDSPVIPMAIVASGEFTNSFLLYVS